MDRLLAELGLSNKEASVYLSVLETGAETVSTIAQKARLNRTTCYDILENLTSMGIVTRVGDKRKKTYTAEPPESLAAYLEKKSKEYQYKAEEVRFIMPQLKAMFNEKGTRPRIRFYEGSQGLETVYEDTLTSHETIRAYASVRDMHGALPHYFPAYYQRRANKGIGIRAILPATKDGIERAKRDKEEARTSALVPTDRFDFSPEINIYDDKVAIMSLVEEFGVIIESKEIAEAQKKVFELAWLGAQKVSAK